MLSLRDPSTGHCQDESTQLDLALYVQYDRHGQQAVDERIQTRCRLTRPPVVEEVVAANSDHVHRNSVLSSAMEKIARRADTGQVIPPVENDTPKLPPRFVTAPTKNLPITNYQGDNCLLVF